ncbi:MAG: hypothetical protein ABIT37_03495 [Luteolibacter sp.]
MDLDSLFRGLALFAASPVDSQKSENASTASRSAEKTKGVRVILGPCDSTWSMRLAHEASQLIKGKRIPDFTPSERSLKRSPFPVIDYVTDQFSTSSTGRAEKLPPRDRKELRQRRRLSKRDSRPPCPVIHVRRYEKPSWLTSSGVNRKRKLIESKGLPSMKNWRFITLTVDREKFPCPLMAYLHGSDHMRRFLDLCRKNKIWKHSCKWAWKLEFQADWQGYPHWHLFVGHRMKLTHKQLAKINELWAMGRTSVERIEDSRIGYGFKYAFKPVSMACDDGEDDGFERLAPNWFLDHVGKKRVKVKDSDGFVSEAEKPVTFKRVRFWQTSKGFYTGRKIESRPAKAQKTWSVPVTVRESLETDGRTVQVIARRRSGQYETSLCVVLDKPLENFWNLVGFDTMNAGAVGLGVYSFVVPTHRLTTDLKTSWQLKPLLLLNRLNLRQAAKLQQAGETLRTC